MRILILLNLLAFVFFANVTSAAQSTVNCHCFTDRTFDHQNPEKVVPYLLATTQNSFLAVAFKAQKFRLVKGLMSGLSSDQLWISHYVGALSGHDAGAVLSLRRDKGSWLPTVQAAGLSEEQIPPAINAALETTDEARLAAAVVDATLLSVLKVDAEQLKTVRAAGADNRETILSFFLAERTGQSGVEIYQSVLDKATNWGTLAFVNNVQIGEMEQEFKALLD